MKRITSYLIFALEGLLLRSRGLLFGSRGEGKRRDSKQKAGNDYAGHILNLDDGGGWLVGYPMWLL